MKEEIKELRVRIDGLSQLVKELKELKHCTTPIAGEDNILRQSIVHKHFTSHEVNKCYDSLILAKVWLGFELERIKNNK